MVPKWKRIYIGEGTQIGAYSVIHGGCKIGENVRISPNVEIYPDCVIGSETFIGHGCTLRPGTQIGSGCKVGHLTVFEGKSIVGNDCVIHAQCHITKEVKIGHGVFIAPLFCGANDPVMAHMRRDILPDHLEPYVIGNYVRIAIGVSFLPGVVIGNNAFIGAHALITKDVPENAIMIGVPAKKVGEIPEEERL